MLLHGSLATSFVCVCAVSVGASGCFIKFEVVLAAVGEKFPTWTKCAPYSQVIFLTFNKFLSPTLKNVLCSRGTSGKLHAAACSAHVVDAAIAIPFPLAGDD